MEVRHEYGMSEDTTCIFPSANAAHYDALDLCCTPFLPFFMERALTYYISLYYEKKNESASGTSLFGVITMCS
jgi:hypothetical protein